MKWLVSISATFLLSATPWANAAVFTCGWGPITVVGVGDDGRVAINVPGSTAVIYLCSLNDAALAPGANASPFPSSSCKAWYAQVLAARSLNKDMLLVFNTANARSTPATPPSATSCADVIANWNWNGGQYPNPMPYFLQTQN